MCICCSVKVINMLLTAKGATFQQQRLGSLHTGRLADYLAVMVSVNYNISSLIINFKLLTF